MEIHYWWVGLSCLVMVLSRGAHTASVEPRLEHSFDLGQLRCCARPRDSEICPEMSDYIPCTVANEMERREHRINMTVQNHKKNPAIVNCSDNIIHVLCEQSFPTCVIKSDGSHEVHLPARSICEEKLGGDDCATLRGTTEIEEICSLYENTSTDYSVGDCSLPNITLNYCTIDWYLPAWLHQYVKQIDLQLNNLESEITGDCWEDFIDARCKSVGRCWALGDRLEHILSNETCNHALRCLEADVLRTNSLILGCQFLPKNSSRHATSSTDFTLTTPTTMQPPTTPSTTTKSDFPTHPLPTELEGSALVSTSSISLVLLTLIISLLVR